MEVVIGGLERFESLIKTYLFNILKYLYSNCLRFMLSQQRSMPNGGKLQVETSSSKKAVHVVNYVWLKIFRH